MRHSTIYFSKFQSKFTNYNHSKTNESVVDDYIVEHLRTTNTSINHNSERCQYT